MDDNESRRHQMFVRVRDFAQAHGDDFSQQSMARQYFTELETVITNLDTHAAAEASGHAASRQGTVTRAQARESLREGMEGISRTARAMPVEIAGVQDRFHLPRGNNDQNLLSAARSFIADADPLKAQFFAHEMPVTFLDDLQDDIDALEAAITVQGSGVGNHVAAGAVIDDQIDHGVDLVRKLDAILRNKYMNNPGRLAEWLSASHTERAPRHAGAPPPPPATPTQPSA